MKNFKKHRIIKPTNLNYFTAEKLISKSSEINRLTRKPPTTKPSTTKKASSTDRPSQKRQTTTTTTLKKNTTKTTSAYPPRDEYCFNFQIKPNKPLTLTDVFR